MLKMKIILKIGIPTREASLQGCPKYPDSHSVIRGNI
jgi:hypothetical protein